ncbi:MAG: glycerol-3-phosphate 1-O-acyltransferase PlsY [Xanthomonadales bacterium]|nr:glycerol-3-phosphate 1-O-acyltransferase PlsY [Xanthomonadales bacterium]
MLESLLAILLAYLLGSVSGSLVLGRLRKVDIREQGSGNAGGTNALRTQGFWFALGVVIIDIGKGALAVSLLPQRLGVSAPTVLMLCGFAAVLGHCYPLWHGFRGGKGAGTAVGTLLVFNAWLFLPMLLCWLLVLTASGYVGLATVICGFSLIPAAWLLGGPPGIVAYAVAIALLLAWTHRGNFQRLRSGQENRFDKVRLAHWLRSK